MQRSFLGQAARLTALRPRALRQPRALTVSADAERVFASFDVYKGADGSYWRRELPRELPELRFMVASGRTLWLSQQRAAGGLSWSAGRRTLLELTVER